MDITKRKLIIAGNWKMNKTEKETVSFFKELNSFSQDIKCDVVVCVPYTDIEVAVRETKNTKIKIAAQNCHFELYGAYTGEISVSMLKEKGVFGVIIGHSERRSYFNETDETINLKLKAVLKQELFPIVCVGETLKQRELGITNEIISMQLKRAFLGILNEQVKNIVVAYEPVWAIGTGKTASNDQAQEVCATIRNVLKDIYGEYVASSVSILYGGSMNPKNCEGLMLQKDIDGGLIGGASLKPKDFLDIINVADKYF